MTKYVSKFNILGETPIYVKDSEARQLIEQEVQNRESADTIINNAISAEATARSSAVTAERMERIYADNQLRALINEAGGFSGSMGYIGMCHIYDEDLTGIIYTEDFDSIHVVKKLPYKSDAASLYKVGNYYYATYGRYYEKSTDLDTWADGANTAPNPFGYTRNWGGHIQKMDDGRYIWIMTCQYRPDTDTFVNDAGDTSYYFKTMYCYITFTAAGEIVFPETLQEFPLNPTDSVIDPWLVYHTEDRLYYFAIKDEHTTSISWYTGATISGLSLHHTNPAYGTEAPCMVITSDNDIVTTADFYISKLKSRLGIYFDDDQIPLYGWVRREGRTRLPIWSTSATSANLRHCTWIPCDADTYNLIFSAGMHFSAVNKGHKPFNNRIAYLYNKTGSTTYTVQPIEGMTYIEIYENIPALTLVVPKDRFIGGNDILIWPNNPCALTYRNVTYNLDVTHPLILKYGHNNYFPFMPVPNQ